MFSRKYVFETQATRYKRTIANSLLSTFFLLCFLVAIISFIPIYGLSLNDTAESFFFKKMPDLIIVLTGDKGRIEAAIDLKMNKYRDSKILISGVYNKNNLKNIINALPIESNNLPRDVEIDYLPKNTLQNALSSLLYIRKNPEFKNILVLTNDYHIMRAQLFFNHLGPNMPKINLYFKAVRTDYRESRNLKILIKEFFKMIKALTIINFNKGDLEDLKNKFNQEWGDEF